MSVCSRRLHAYQCALLWSHSAGFMHHITTTAFPMSTPPPSAPKCDLSHQMGRVSCVPAGALAQHHKLLLAWYSVHLYGMQINESCPSCVYFRWLLQHETGQQKHQCVFIMLQFMGTVCIKWYKSGKCGVEKNYLVLLLVIFRLELFLAPLFGFPTQFALYNLGHSERVCITGLTGVF